MYSHTLGKDVALGKVKTALVDAQTKFAEFISDTHEEWDGYIGNLGFVAKGFTLNVKIEVKDDLVIIGGKIPWFLLPLQPKIEKILADNVAQILVA